MKVSISPFLKMASSILALSVITACGGIDGNLTVTQKMNLTDRHGDKTEIAAGTYAVNLKYKENKNRLIIKFDKLNGEKTTIETNTPEGFDIPDNGHFAIKAQDYGQNVDLQGDVVTTKERSENRFNRQTCTYTDYQTICNTNPQGHTSCYQQPINRQGWQDTEYYVVTTEQTLTAQFNLAGTETSVANLNAHAVYSQQVNVWTSTCR